MANETEISNSAHVTDVISDGISAALVEQVVCLPHVYSEDLPVGTAVKLFRKDGSLTAENINESASYTFSASSELTQTTVSATAVKTVCVSKNTIESQQFGLIDNAKLIREQAAAIARKLDDDVLALFSGFTGNTAVTSTNILTVADIMQAVYSVNAAYASPMNGQLVGIFDFKGINEVRKELVASGASVFSMPSMATLLANMPEKPKGYAGSLPGVDLYQIAGLPTSGGDDVALVFNPALAFAGMYSPSVITKMVWVGSGGFWDEIASILFNKVVEYNDTAGCRVLSDT